MPCLLSSDGHAAEDVNLSGSIDNADQRLAMRQTAIRQKAMCQEVHA